MKLSNKMQYMIKFNCRISMAEIDYRLALHDSENNHYLLSDLKENELDNLIKQSLDTGEDVLLKRVKKYVFIYDALPEDVLT